MYGSEDEVHEAATEARAGVNVPGMTTVLLGSLALVIVLFPRSGSHGPDCHAA
jgi:hypothetical protein